MSQTTNVQTIVLRYDKSVHHKCDVMLTFASEVMRHPILIINMHTIFIYMKLSTRIVRLHKIQCKNKKSRKIIVFEKRLHVPRLKMAGDIKGVFENNSKRSTIDSRRQF